MCKVLGIAGKLAAAVALAGVVCFGFCVIDEYTRTHGEK